MQKAKIVVDPNVHLGKPCIAGTRIKVQDVLELVQEGTLFSEIVEKYYPNLSIEDVKACVKYALDIISSEEVYITKAG
ncbi:MAG: DUF433 domain-containing protein [Deltaproteobacteria bacterium]|nr:DUF433 domain-containing protein [Deltaproteobacteria bacterium]